VLSDAHLWHGSDPACAWPPIIVIAIAPQRPVHRDRNILLAAERLSVLNVAPQCGASGP
jgi:hypothetical protein